MDFARKINIIGDIDEVAYKEFVERMDEIDEMLEGDDVLIELCSHGGDAMVALAFHDRIIRSKNPITIVATGMVASAAVIILAAGDKRHMTKSAWVMVHEDTVPVTEDDKVSQIEKQAGISRQFEVQWCNLLAKRTKASSSRWETLHADETYLSAEECLELGLVNKII